MGLFSSTSKDEPEEKNRAKRDAREELVENLKQRFAYARYGDHCQTTAFYDELKDQIEWLKGVEDPSTQTWIVVRVEAGNDYFSQDNPDGKRAENRHLEKVGLSFFEAMEKLAEYEDLRRELEAYAPHGPSAEEMGFTHFKSFAEREGIVFDLLRNPHPTLDGHVVTPGNFPEGVEEKSREYVQNPPKDRPKHKTGLGVTFNEKSKMESLDRLMGARKNLEKFKSFMRDLRSMRAMTARYYGPSFNNIEPGREKFLQLYDVSPSDLDLLINDWGVLYNNDDNSELSRPSVKTLKNEKNFSSMSFYWMFERAEKTLASALSKAELELVKPMLEKQKIYFEMYRAAAFMRLIQQDHQDSEAFTEYFKESVDRIEKLGKASGYDESQIAEFKQLAYAAEPLEEPEDMSGFLKECENLEAAMEQEIIRQKGMVSKPSPAVPGPSPS